MPTWPASPLDQITEATPHRFRIWLSETDAPRATALLAEPDRLGRELNVEAGPIVERGAPLNIESTFSPRTAAILRPLNALGRAGIRVIGFEALDLVNDITDGALAAAVAAWGTHANRGPHRHRLEVLAGQGLLNRNAMAAALGAMAVHWPDEARPVWRHFLESRSVPLRWAAEETLGLHGTEEDQERIDLAE